MEPKLCQSHSRRSVITVEFGSIGLRAASTQGVCAEQKDCSLSSGPFEWMGARINASEELVQRKMGFFAKIMGRISSSLVIVFPVR